MSAGKQIGQILIGDGKHPPIQIWRFEDAPRSLRNLVKVSEEGIWVALVPDGYVTWRWNRDEKPLAGWKLISTHQIPGVGMVFIANIEEQRRHHDDNQNTADDSDSGAGAEGNFNSFEDPPPGRIA